jgi:hypothetical protein
MNYKLTILTILTSFVLFGQSNLEGTDVYQSGYDYYNLRVNNLKEFKFRDIKIKEIRQTTLHSYYNIDLKKTDSSFYLEYVIKFDSINNVVSVLYDFMKEYISNEKLISKNSEVLLPVNRNELNSIDRLYKFATIDDTIFYNFYENIYEYDEFGGELKSIRIVRPLRDGIINGVYIQELKNENIRYKNYFKDDLLIKKEMYIDEKLEWTTEYFYQTIQTRYNTLNLVEKIIEQNENGDKYEINLEYIFNKQ